MGGTSQVTCSVNCGGGLGLTATWELYQNVKPGGLLFEQRRSSSAVFGPYGTVISPDYKLAQAAVSASSAFNIGAFNAHIQFNATNYNANVSTVAFKPRDSGVNLFSNTQSPSIPNTQGYIAFKDTSGPLPVYGGVPSDYLLGSFRGRTGRACGY